MNGPYEKDEQFANREAFSTYQEPAPPKHDGLGIASFVLSLAGIVSFVVVTIVVFVRFAQAIDFTQIVDANGNQLMTDEEIYEKVEPLVGYLTLYPLVLLIVLVGLILGIVSLTRPRTKKIFGILGTVFNGLPVLFVAMIFLFGLALS